MKSKQKSSQITLEEIAQRKEKALQELRDQKEKMSATARSIFAPLAPAASKGNAILRSFNTGMAIFDGVMLGIKLMKKVRRLMK
ncbi:MAG: hypothetical protein RR365_07715 [Bacteroides sp.]